MGYHTHYNRRELFSCEDAMTVQITIVGLGQIGSSIGLALKARGLDLRLVGHDKDVETAKEAQKLGAVDDVKYNLPAAVRGSKIIVLALPFAGIRETLEVIVPDLQEGSLVLDTAPSKAVISAWAAELLPEGRYYLGLTPAINPEYLHGTEYGVKAARADLFDKGLVVVNTPSGTPGNVFNIGMEFVTLIGAVPLLMDTAEVDGIFAAIHLLPQLASTALLDAILEKPG
jgi:prephenate dehydrogenase